MAKRKNTKGQTTIYKTLPRRRLNVEQHGGVSSSYSTSEARRVTLVTNPVISHEQGKGFKHILYIQLKSI